MCHVNRQWPLNRKKVLQSTSLTAMVVGMNVFLLEDEQKVSRFISESLKADGYQVQSVHALREARDWIQDSKETFDLAVLDRMVDGRDAIELIAELKKNWKNCRVLVLSAINTPDEKASALDLGADDYLAKPFSYVELSARLRALGRRNQESFAKPTHLVVGNLSVDLLAHQALVAGRRLDLSQKEFQLLLCLIQRPGQVYNRFQLLDRVWDTQFDLESNVVEVTMKNLRRKLEGAKAAAVIQSKRHLGYWLEAVA